MTRILLIDDDNRLRRNCAALLRTEGFTVIEASDGQQGITTTHLERPDLIICDVNMPAMNGHSVLTGIRKHPDTQNVPFIFLTGDGEMKHLRRTRTPVVAVSFPASCARRWLSAVVRIRWTFCTETKTEVA